MDFENFFSKSDILGMMMKQSVRNQIIKALKGVDEELRLPILEIEAEVIGELIQEYKERDVNK